MITQKRYDLLKEKYGDVASWAIWKEPDLQVGAKSNISDLSLFESPDILNMLNPQYVFVGLNAASHDLFDYKPWMGFHSSDTRRAQDYKLRDAIFKTPLWGGYITDIIKGFPETDSSKVMREIKRNPQKLDENIEKFRNEIEILGTRPVIIALGDKPYDLLIKASFNQDFEVVKITHYSSTTKTKVSYRQEVEDVISHLHLK